MRTQQEILDRIEEVKDWDVFGFCSSDLLSCLSYENVKSFLKEGVTEEDWHPESVDLDAVKDRILDYMPFAWDKANNCRGLSAGRSISHMQAWLWLLGEDDVADALDDYSHYGKPQLRAICEHFGLDWRQWDNGKWRNSELEHGTPPPAETIKLPWKEMSAA